jgi:hypothetical protein
VARGANLFVAVPGLLERSPPGRLVTLRARQLGALFDDLRLEHARSGRCDERLGGIERRLGRDGESRSAGFAERCLFAVRVLAGGAVQPDLSRYARSATLDRCSIWPSAR